MALRATARRALACEHEAAELEAQLDALVARMAPTLLDEVGVGPVVAAQLHRVVVPSRPGPFRSGLRGSPAWPRSRPPREPSSGTGSTGPGTANSTGRCTPSCMVRMRQDPETTKTYVQRRIAEGKSIREIKRCLEALRRPPALPTAREHRDRT